MVCEWSPSDSFGWTRNHYDRLVHFAYGLLITVPFFEWHYSKPSSRWDSAAIASLSFILATSSIYEIFEWQLAQFAAPETAESYNGQQGDSWDAQKDMALAACGSLLSLAILGLLSISKRGRRDRPED